ncbi:hypothetical protein B5F29_11520 [Lachnoclostridium sp. An196]|uniref:hypothetical protein n=1 Tax=Lachnoclostridium sp. An196 TaxID=1965583 RepID=UPI000B3A79F6|nr:hypothetical protein [Lachnoclostridium sp. An196]OUP18421.1 hypothetical protein B5F29_11520 [Lachnoclostridium sp. An196]
MKITVEFANLDEFKQYMGIESPSLLAQAPKEAADAPAPAPAEAVQEPQEAPETPAPKKNAKKTEKAAPAAAEPAPEPADDPAPDESAPAVTEDFRITVRKQLAALNKKCGYNRAAELINEQTGKGKLTEVALADLPKLMEAAKEETNAD